MNYLKNLSFRAKITVGFTIIFVSIGIALLIALYSLNHILDSKAELDEIQDAARELTHLRSDQNYLNTLMLSAMIAPTEFERAIIVQDIERLRQNIDLQISGFHDRIESVSEATAIFDRVLRLKEDTDAIQIRQIEMLKLDKTEAAHTLYINEGHAAGEALKREIEVLEENIDVHADYLLEQSNAVVNNSYVSLSLLGFFIMLITLVIIIATLKMNTRIARDIKEGVSVLGSSTAEIQTTVAEISTGATETATAISETTTTVEEIRQTSMVAGEKAKNLLNTSQKSAEMGERGLESSQEMMDSMQQIANQMKIIHETITKLAEQNRSIGEITSTVADIADQSNLLAVNAAIEAAKAGEHGRGFSVVAQEIRTLAEQSKKSTVQVKEILNEIQNSVTKAVDVINEGSSIVKDGGRIVKEDREVVEMLIDTINEATEAAVQISSSSQQQIAGMDQIVPAMENIKQASEQNVTGIGQTQEAAKSLHELSDKLKQVIERYRL